MLRLWTFAGTVLAVGLALGVAAALAVGQLRDGHVLAFSRTMPSGYDDLWLYDLERGFSAPITSTPEVSENSPVWSSGGRLAYLRLTPAEGPNHCEVIVDRHISLGSWFLCSAPDWSMDGQLAFSVWDGESHTILIWDGTALTPRLHRIGDGQSPVWSDDGRLAYLRFTPWSSEVWAETSPGRLIPLLPQNMEARPPIWSSCIGAPCIQRLAYIVEDSRLGGTSVYIWDGQATRLISQGFTYYGSLT